MSKYLLSQARIPALHVCSKFGSPGFPHFSNQAPPREQQLSLPDPCLTPHLGHLFFFLTDRVVAVGASICVHGRDIFIQEKDTPISNQSVSVLFYPSTRQTNVPAVEIGAVASSSVTTVDTGMPCKLRRKIRCRYRIENLPSQAWTPSSHVYSKFRSPGLPHFLNQAPPRKQQLRLPVF